MPVTNARWRLRIIAILVVSWVVTLILALVLLTSPATPSRWSAHVADGTTLRGTLQISSNAPSQRGFISASGAFVDGAWYQLSQSGDTTHVALVRDSLGSGATTQFQLSRTVTTSCAPSFLESTRLIIFCRQGDGEVIALSKFGRVKWTTRLGPMNNAHYAGATQVNGDLVVDQWSYLSDRLINVRRYDLNPSGQLNHSFKITLHLLAPVARLNPYSATMAISPSGASLFFANAQDGYAKSINGNGEVATEIGPNGATIWSRIFPGYWNVDEAVSATSVPHGSFIATISDTYDGSALRISSSGVRMWFWTRSATIGFSGPILPSAIVVGPDNTVTVVGDIGRPFHAPLANGQPAESLWIAQLNLTTGRRSDLLSLDSDPRILGGNTTLEPVAVIWSPRLQILEVPLAKSPSYVQTSSTVGAIVTDLPRKHIA